MMTVGSLFSGIGGLDLGLERAGMKVIWQSEIDPYACKVLKKHWPEVPNYGNIKEIDWRNIVRPDVICGGYPCQPFSQAGKRLGTDDPRHLWPWVRDAISNLRPDFAVLENVRGHLSLGLTTVLGEMSEIGYDAEWQIVSAAGVGAPHRRDRVFIVAYPNGSNEADGRKRQNVSSEDRSRRDDGRGSGSDIGEECVGSTRPNTGNVADAQGDGLQEQCKPIEPSTKLPGSRGNGTDVANADSFGLERSRAEQQAARPTRSSENKRRAMANPYGNGAQIQASGFFSGIKEFERYTWWETEPDVGRVAHGVPSRVDRLKCLGNAVVPQVAEYVGRMIVEATQ